MKRESELLHQQIDFLIVLINVRNNMYVTIEVNQDRDPDQRIHSNSVSPASLPMPHLTVAHHDFATVYFLFAIEAK